MSIFSCTIGPFNTACESVLSSLLMIGKRNAIRYGSLASLLATVSLWSKFMYSFFPASFRDPFRPATNEDFYQWSGQLQKYNVIYKRGIDINRILMHNIQCSVLNSGWWISDESEQTFGCISTRLPKSLKSLLSPFNRSCIELLLLQYLRIGRPLVF